MQSEHQLSEIRAKFGGTISQTSEDEWRSDREVLDQFLDARLELQLSDYPDLETEVTQSSAVVLNGNSL
jgi:hypothetical protein